MKSGFATGLVALFYVALFTPVSPGAQEMEFRASAEQVVGASLLLDASLPATYGSSSSLDGALEFSHGVASIKLSGRLSILYGSRATNARAALALDPDSRIGVLTSPGYNPETYDPTNPDSSWFTTLALNEAVMSFSYDKMSVEIGKTIVNWGVGTAFSPADFFSDIDYAGGSPSRRSSFLGRLSWFPGPVSRVDIAAEPFSYTGATYALRGYSIIGDAVAFAIEAGYRQGIAPSSSLIIAAVELSLDIPVISPYGEIATSFELGGSRKLSYKALAGAQSRIGNLSLMAEYCYNDTLTSLHKAFLRAALPLGDWVNLAVPAFIDFTSGSFSSGLIVAIPDFEGIALALSVSASRSASGNWSAGADLSARASF